MSNHGRYDKTFRDKPILDYILHKVPQDEFQTQLEPIAETKEFDTVLSLGKKASFADENDQRALDLVKSQLQKVLPMPIESNDDVLNAAVGISSRILNGFSHHPGIDF